MYFHVIFHGYGILSKTLGIKGVFSALIVNASSSYVLSVFLLILLFSVLCKSLLVSPISPNICWIAILSFLDLESPNQVLLSLLSVWWIRLAGANKESLQRDSDEKINGNIDPMTAFCERRWNLCQGSLGN